MDPGGSMPHSQEFKSRFNPIPRIDTYFFKFDSNIVLPSAHRPSYRSRSCKILIFESTPTFFYSGHMTCPHL